jgi:limonene-1,2-epoxide hydrolase
MTDSISTAVVERFIDHLRTVTDNDAAVGLLAEDVVYENSWLPTVHGRERVRKVFQALLRIGTEVEMHVHAISADGPTVLTERTDVLQWGRLRIQFWICGRFDVHDGQIVEWREYYDPLVILTATLRGLLGTVVPAARAKPPSAVGAPSHSSVRHQDGRAPHAHVLLRLVSGATLALTGAWTFGVRAAALTAAAGTVTAVGRR